VFSEVHCPQFLSDQVSPTEHTPVWLMVAQANSLGSHIAENGYSFIWTCYTNNTAN